MVDISERRLVLRMLARWSDLKEERTFPAAAEMDSAAVGEDWRFCALLALQEAVAASPFLHVGSALDPVRADGHAPNGRASCRARVGEYVDNSEVAGLI